MRTESNERKHPAWRYLPLALILAGSVTLVLSLTGMQSFDLRAWSWPVLVVGAALLVVGVFMEQRKRR